jgi:hypothetical protein
MTWVHLMMTQNSNGPTWVATRNILSLAEPEQGERHQNSVSLLCDIGIQAVASARLKIDSSAIWRTNDLSLDDVLPVVTIFYVDPKYETRKTKKAFYIPRDECFERTKMGDFMADGLRSIVHSTTSKISLQLRRKSEFDSIEEIKKLYSAKGKKVGRINNVLPDKTNVLARNQQSLVFLNEVLRPDGQPVDPLLYPLPRILQGSF